MTRLGPPILPWSRAVCRPVWVRSTMSSRSSKDYIAEPKPNGYKSLHAIIEIPVFLSTGPVPVTVEVQIRTIAMDFWASLEHKIYYKYDGEVPGHLAASLSDAADVASQLDRRMEELHHEVRGAKPAPDDGTATDGIDEQLLVSLWERTRPEAPP